MKICIFPNDPILAYYKKGEIKERYYNPNNFFDEIHIISLIEKDVEESKIQNIVGEAKLKIHSVGKWNLKNRKSGFEKIEKIVNEIKPNVIRAYSPYLTGWFAAKCAKNLKIPFYLSLHTNYQYNKTNIKKTNLKKYFSFKFTEKFIEPYVLKHADKITIVYKIIEPYVLKHGGRKPEVVYNKIDFKKFENATPKNDLDKPLIISVGNLIPEKNHECLIQAMENIDASLIIIGNGVRHNFLTNLIEKKKLQNKIKIIKSVPHDEIPRYYKSADVFALAYDPNVESIPMPVVESMASGIPVIVSEPENGDIEEIGDSVIFCKRNPDSFAENIMKILKNRELSEKMTKSSQKILNKFDSNVIESREAQIYLELINKNTNF